MYASLVLTKLQLCQPGCVLPSRQFTKMNSLAMHEVLLNRTFNNTVQPRESSTEGQFTNFYENPTQRLTICRIS